MDQELAMTDRSNVLTFREPATRQWRTYDRCLRENFEAREGLSQSEIDDMVGRLRDIYLKHAGYAENHPWLSDPDKDPVQKVEAWILQMLFGFMLEIAQREGELIALRGNNA